MSDEEKDLEPKGDEADDDQDLDLDEEVIDDGDGSGDGDEADKGEGDEGDGSDDPEALKAENKRLKDEKKTLETKNRQLYARVKKGGVQKPNSTSPDEVSDIRKTVNKLALSETKRQFGHEHGLSPEETDAVFKINSKPSKKTLEDPFVKGGLEAIRAKSRAANNTPSPSGRKPMANGKAWADMTAEERSKNYHDVLKNRIGK